VVKRWTIADHVPAEAFGAGVRSALEALGYDFAPAASPGTPGRPPDLRIVDEQSIDRIPSAPVSPSIPNVLLTRGGGPDSPDPRIVASMPQPASLSGLYACLQRALENKQRAAPRVATELSARCWRGNDFWNGTVLTLSETGCLFRSGPRLLPEQEIMLIFDLPRDTTISTGAHPVHRKDHEVGLAFENLIPESGADISHYVIDQLTAVA
jgi:hypothetical protein